MPRLFAPENGEEHESQAPPKRPLDTISERLGTGIYIERHRLSLQIVEGAFRSPRLRISRFYWDLTPPVAVDFVRELRHGAVEVAAKRDYFKKAGIRYILASNEWDEEAQGLNKPGVSRSSAPESRPPESSPTTGRRPVTAPREEKR